MIVKADSGASRHYFRDCDKHVLQNTVPTKGPTVYLPDMSSLNATEKGFLPIDQLSRIASEAHVFKKLHSSSLLSIGQLCDDDCLVLLHKNFLYAFKNWKPILYGTRNHTDGLWDIQLHPPTVPPIRDRANIIVQKSMTKKDLIHFFHGACFSPVKSTLLTAIKNGNFLT